MNRGTVPRLGAAIRTPNMRSRILLIGLLLSPGCRSTTIEIPPIERRGIESQVRAYSVADAERVRALADRLIPQVRAIKSATGPGPLVLLCREELPLELTAACGGSMVFLGPRSRVKEASSLAHELSHWFRDDVWMRLPYALEEGLAAYVASLVVPQESSVYMHGFVVALPEDVGIEGFRSACAATFEAQATRSFDEEVRIRGIGLAVASAIGVETLRALCERAVRENLLQVPFEWIREALPFDPEQRGSFRAAIRRRQIAIDRQRDEEAAGAAGSAPGSGSTQPGPEPGSTPRT